jgi:AcrR family transcriptional regulator
MENDMSTLILDQASLLFEQRGYAAVSMREICAACGVTKPTLYYYFADKEALYVATLLRLLTGFRDTLAAQTPDESVLARLTRLAVSILDQMHINVDVMMRDMENITNPAHHQELGAAFGRELYGPVLGAIASGIERGELRPGDPALYTKTYLGLLNAFVVEPARDGGPPAVEWVSLPTAPGPRAALVMDLLFHGIGAKP